MKLTLHFNANESGGVLWIQKIVLTNSPDRRNVALLICNLILVASYENNRTEKDLIIQLAT